MPSILFWNVQRFGRGSSDIFRANIADLVNLVEDSHEIEEAYFCEMTSDTSIDDIALTKQAAVRRRNPRANSAQLGYAAVDLGTGNQLPLATTPVANYNDVYGYRMPYRGGNAFTDQSKRYFTHRGTVAGVHLFMYHANSSYKAAELVAWSVENVRILYPNAPFIIFGDMNCEPWEIEGINAYHNGPTHHVRSGLNRTYDWAVASGPIEVERIMVTDLLSSSYCGLAAWFGYKRYDPAELPDHLPIVISW